METKPRFVIHEHHATNLHFDLRLEIGGVLKSWAVPKGLSLNPNHKRLAIEVPDHSLSYINFEGTISEGKYGAGAVVVWDNGDFRADGDAAEQLESGRLNFTFYGKKLRGAFSLVRMKDRKNQWLVIKNRDEFADLNWELKTVFARRKVNNQSRFKDFRRRGNFISLISFNAKIIRFSASSAPSAVNKIFAIIKL